MSKENNSCFLTSIQETTLQHLTELLVLVCFKTVFGHLDLMCPFTKRLKHFLTSGVRLYKTFELLGQFLSKPDFKQQSTDSRSVLTGLISISSEVNK